MLFCEAGCARAPSERFGPCCDPEDCARCYTGRGTRCEGAFGGEYAYGHLNWIEYELAPR